MKVLVIGKGGREHAICEALKRSSLVSEIYISPNNVGATYFAKPVYIDDDNINALVDFAKNERIDLTIVGPEHTLALGIADLFKKNNLRIFAPTKDAASIETSKHFCKQIMEKYNIPTADYKVFIDFDAAFSYVKEVGAPIVIKEDGLKQGKGVTVAMTEEEAFKALKSAFKNENKVVVEDFLEGKEFSLIAMVNEDAVVVLDPARDYKRVGDLDKGANTGGMGAFSPVNYITDEIKKEAVDLVIKPMANALLKEGIPFTGFMYGGLILTKSGIKTIEFNARLGDPESHVILERLESDFVKLILDVLDKKEVSARFINEKALCVVLASNGYPSSSTISSDIQIDDGIISKVIHMGTKFENGSLKTNGGRVLSLICKGNTINDCIKNVYQDIEKIHCKHIFYRRDIGRGIDD